jgi:hypothetical protein
MAAECVYNTDIQVGELTHPGFLHPLSIPPIPPFHPTLPPIDILQSVTCLSGFIDDICTRFRDSIVRMFCSEFDITSRLRFILFCAFGMLFNFVNQSKFKLLLRGGMALRMNLIYFDEYMPYQLKLLDSLIMGEVQKMKMHESTTIIDMDAVVIVDSSVEQTEMEQFKIIFIKVLLHSIRKIATEKDFRIICTTAIGDANTTKIIVQKNEITVGLADISFKYSTDPVIRGYRHYNKQKTFFWLTPYSELPFTWVYPDIAQLANEYRYVLGKLEKEKADLREPQEINRNDYNMKRFSFKHNIAETVARLISKQGFTPAPTINQIRTLKFGGKKRKRKQKKTIRHTNRT